jgi:hypothetical protein
LGDALHLGQRVWWRVTGRAGRGPTVREGVVVFLGHLPRLWHYFPERLPVSGWRTPQDRIDLIAARGGRAKLKIGHGVVVRTDVEGAKGRALLPTFHAPHPQHLQQQHEAP